MVWQSTVGLEDGSMDLVGLKDGKGLGAKLELGDELGLQSFPQKGPKSACTGSLVNVQAVP